MKKYFSLFLLLIPLLADAQIYDQLQIMQNDFSVIQQDGYDKIQYQEKYLQEPGKPKLPVVSRSFVIPTDAIVTGLDVTINKETQLPGTFFVYPAQPPRTIQNNSDPTFVIPDSTYNSQSPYPQNAAIIASDNIIQGYHVVTINYYPFMYLPAKRELYLRDISITIQYGGSGNVTTNNTPISYYRANLAKGFVKSIVWNPGDVDRYYNAFHVIPQKLSLNKDGNDRKTKSINVLEEIVPDYVIITCDSLKASFKLLADWKTKKGIPTIIQTVEVIDKDYIGSDLAEKIRNYLIDVNKRWNGISLFVLLGGDTNIIPTRSYEQALKPKEVTQATDAYFVANQFSWTPKEGKHYITSECITSSYLGRMPVKNKLEANNLIKKTISYEKVMEPGVDYSYFNNTLVAAAFLDKIKKRTKTDNIYGDSLTDGHRGFLYSYCLNRPNKYRFLFDHFNCTKDDHEDDPLYVNIKNAKEFNKANFTSAITNGDKPEINNFHFIYHVDHSTTSNMGTSSKDKGENFNNNDVDNAVFPKFYYQVYMSGGCHPADFYRDCIAEHLVNKVDAGAVAFIGNTDVGYFDEYEQLKRVLNAAFSTKVECPGQYSLGYMLQAALSENNNHNSRHRLHLLGDPETPLWTSTPKDLIVNVTPSSVTNGETEITIKVANLPAGQQAMVCLKKGIEVYNSYIIRDTKAHKFPFSPRTSGWLDITVTAHNFRPVETGLMVNTNASSALSISEMSIHDDKTGGSIGNGDGHADAGETIELSMVLKNNGLSSVNNVKGVLSCNSDSIIMQKDTVYFGDITSMSTTSSKSKFRFRIKPGTPESLRNDLKAIRFNLDVTDDNGTFYPDTFSLEVYAPKIELRSQIVEGPLTANSRNDLYISLMNAGKSEIGPLQGMLTIYTNPNVGSIPVPISNYSKIGKDQIVSNSNPFVFYTTSVYTTGKPLKMQLTVRNEYGRTWKFDIDPADVADSLKVSEITFKSSDKYIEMFWNKKPGVSAYTIYRSSNGIDGNYVKLNKQPVSLNYFKDDTVNPGSIYYYKINSVSYSRNERMMFGAMKAWTSLPIVGLFPRSLAGSKTNLGSVCVGDVNNDGKKEIFSLTKIWDDPAKGYLLGMDHTGIDLFDLDGNVTTFSGFAQLAGEAWGTPAIGDLYGNGEQNILVSTRIDMKDYLPKNRLTCFAARDDNSDRLPDILWENLNNEHVYSGAVLSNLDNSVDGTMEVIVEPDDRWQPVSIYDNTGKVIRKLGPGQSLNSNINSPAVADLDKDGDKEIVVGYEDGVHIWHHNGKPYSTNPVFTRSKISFSSSPVIGDLDGDGRKEIVIVAKDTLTAECTVFAIRPDGTLIPGWNGTQKFSSGLIKWESCNLSIGDINGDGKLEVCLIGADCLKIWKNNGTILISKNIPGAKGGDRVPILADVSGDSRPDIIFTVGPAIYAIDCYGKDIPSFPVNTDFIFRGTICVNDIDGDGKSELVAVDEGNTYVWKTNGNPNAIEWGSERHDQWNTGEYGKICEPRLILSSQTWNGVDPCGNVIVERGTLTIPSGKTLSLTDKTSKIIVRPGASLVVDGGTISNAYVRALPGGRVLLKNGGKISLRHGGKMTIDNGATLSNQGGRIE